MINSIDLILSALATLPLSVKKMPGIPGLFQTMAFAGIFAGAGQVFRYKDADTTCTHQNV